MTPGWCKKLFDQEQQLTQGVTPVTIQSIREYVHRLWDQYQVAGRRTKSAILDELERNLGIHRKSANRLMTSEQAPSLGRSKGNRKRHYCESCIALLRQAWREMGYCNSKLLRAGLDGWLPFFDNIDEIIKSKLLKMAASTMDIHLKDDKAKLRRRLNTGTRKSKSRHVTLVPIRDLENRPTEIGHCEVDLVAHCGEWMNGTFAWTLTFTDIVSGWTENETIWGKSGYAVKIALELIEARLPFKIKTLYFDNGSEFLNDDVIEWYANRREIPTRRSRPYKKNDQCFVEQKNYTHVRQVFGYDRIDWKKGVELMNGVYRNERRLLSNFFTPQQKLKEKWREGSKIKKRYHQPMTPFDRIMLAPDVPQEIKEALQHQRDGLNPRKLSKKMRRKMVEFWGYRGKKQRQLTKYAA